jgi:branched-chain amino acid transport system substrate-binding protein
VRKSLVILCLLISLISNTTKIFAAETYKVGVMLPLTGALAEIGHNSKDGILLALDKANKANKYQGKYFEVLLEDTKTSPKEAVNAFNKLINVDKVKFVVGPISSGETLAIAPLAEKNNIILISPGASSPKITEAGEYIFRTWHSTSDEGKYFADYLYNTLRISNLGILVINNEYGLGLLDEFEKSFKQTGGSISFQESFNQGQSDFRPILSKIKPHEKEVNGIYIIGYHNETGLLLKQARELKLNTRFFCSDGNQDPKLLEIAGSSAEGLIYPHAKRPDIVLREVRDFQDEYKGKFGKEYGTTSDTAYDAFNLLVLGIMNKGYNPSLVKDFLTNVKDYSGASGKISIDKYGDIHKEFEIKTIKDGNFVTYQNKNH